MTPATFSDRRSELGPTRPELLVIVNASATPRRMVTAVAAAALHASSLG
jgi:hypothetical protein